MTEEEQQEEQEEVIGTDEESGEDAGISGDDPVDGDSAEGGAEEGSSI